MKTIKDVFLSFRQGLNEVYSNREIEAIALLVLEEITGLSRAKIKAFQDDDVDGKAIEKIKDILIELKTGKPVQYILGSTEFYGLKFLVNPSTLIPRPETEELIEWTLIESKKIKNEKVLSILDIGTGSGCIAITLKKHLPDASITAIDISLDALHTAVQNAAINDVKVSFSEQDILKIGKSSDLKDDIQTLGILSATFDIIISNPPYVTLLDKLQMHSNVTEFEPHSALFVPEQDPLIFYKAITNYAVDHLSTNGLLFFEINENLGSQTVKLLADNNFIDIELRKDMSGKDRMVKAIKR